MSAPHIQTMAFRSILARKRAPVATAVCPVAVPCARCPCTLDPEETFTCNNCGAHICAACTSAPMCTRCDNHIRAPPPAAMPRPIIFARVKQGSLAFQYTVKQRAPQCGTAHGCVRIGLSDAERATVGATLCLTDADDTTDVPCGCAFECNSCGASHACVAELLCSDCDPTRITAADMHEAAKLGTNAEGARVAKLATYHSRRASRAYNPFRDEKDARVPVGTRSAGRVRNWTPRRTATAAENLADARCDCCNS